MNECRDRVHLAKAEGAKGAVRNVVGLRPRTTLVGAALAIVTVGIAMNWSALVAAGVAPLIISALPCAVMCALGLCMSRMGRSTCATATAPQQSAGATRLQVDDAPERMEGPQLAFDLGHPTDREAVEAAHTQHQQERRPIHA